MRNLLYLVFNCKSDLSAVLWPCHRLACKTRTIRCKMTWLSYFYSLNTWQAAVGQALEPSKSKCQMKNHTT